MKSLGSDNLAATARMQGSTASWRVSNAILALLKKSGVGKGPIRGHLMCLTELQMVSSSRPMLSRDQAQPVAGVRCLSTPKQVMVKQHT
jgi:hypothetical protein